MSGTILFKFRNARGEPETVTFDGIHITAVELKNLIAEKKGLTDGTLELSDPKTKAVFDDNHVFPRGSAVTVRRVAASKTQARAQQAAATVDANEEVAAGPAMAALQTLAAARASAAQSVDPSDENAQLEQRKANLGKEDAEIGLLVSAQDEAWRAQSDKNILATRAREQQLAAQRGRGRGFGSSFMHGRGRGPGAQPTGFCKFCGKMNDHYSDDCPQKHNPRTDLRHVRTPAGIPSELLEQTSEGGLLLNTGKTGALKSSTGLAAQAFAALPTAAKRAPAAVPALTNAPNAQGEQPQPQLENGNQQKHSEEQEDAEAAGLDKLGQEDASQQPTPAAAEHAGPSAAILPASDEAAPAVSVEVDVDDAYLFDDDFGFGSAKDSTVAGLFEDAAVLPANGGAAQLKLGLGMELPESEQPEDDSQQRLQESSPLLKKQQQQQLHSPVQQSPGGKGLEGQQQATAAGLKPVDPLQYCNDIILANVPDAGRWALRDIKQAFIHDRPLTPDEFSTLLTKYKRLPAAVAQGQQQQQQQPQDEGARRHPKEGSSRRRSRSHSPVRSQSLTRSRDRAASKRQRKADRSPRSRRSKSRSRSISRERRSKHRSSRSKRDISIDTSRGERARGAAGNSMREQQQHGKREVKSAEKRSASPAQEEVKQAGGAEQGADRRADLAASGPSQDLRSLLEDSEQQQQQQSAGNKAAPPPAGQMAAAADTVSPQSDAPTTASPAAPPAAAAAVVVDGLEAAERPTKRRPITDRLGPQPRSPVRSPTPEPKQQQQQQQEAELPAPQQLEPAGPAEMAANTGRPHSPSSSHGRSSSRSPSRTSGSSRERQHNRRSSRSRSRSRSLSSDSRDKQQQALENIPAAAEEEEEEEKLDFGEEYVEQEDTTAAAGARARASGSDDEMSGDDARVSRRHKHGSSRRSKHNKKKEKKEKKERREKKKRHRSDKRRSRSQTRSRSRPGRRHGYSRSRSPSSSRSPSRDRSRSMSRSRSRSRPRGRTPVLVPESPPAKRSRSSSRREKRKVTEAERQPAPRESIANRLGTRSVAAAGATAGATAAKSASGRLTEAAKRPAPAGGAGRLLGRAFQDLAGASSRSRTGRSAGSGEHGEGSKRTKR